MPLALRAVTQRFPHVGERLAQLFEREESFRELCEEYESCAETVVRLGRSSASEPVRKEYAALLFRLEGELLRYVEERPGG